MRISSKNHGGDLVVNVNKKSNDNILDEIMAAGAMMAAADQPNDAIPVTAFDDEDADATAGQTSR